jgi:hypothetical protein
VPLAAIGLQHGGRIAGLRAFTGLGTYVQGLVSLVDALTISA